MFAEILRAWPPYGLCSYRFKCRNLLYSMVTAGMMFQVILTIIPVFRMQVAMGVAGTGNLCFAIIILMRFISQIFLLPKQVRKAGMIVSAPFSYIDIREYTDSE